MATIVEMINPLTGLPEQVDQLDHTAQEIDDAVDLAPRLSNPNLLDNWYFGNPVNQRGQTEYTANGYTIDRWTLLSNADSKSVSVESGGIGLSGSGGTYTNFTQKVETLPAGVYTLSFLVDDFSKVSQIFNAALGVSIKSFSSNLCSFTFTFSSDASIVSLGIQKTVDSEKLLIYAAKLELGSQQTLAHQDANGNWVLNEIPDYGEQLRRCQRYCIVYKAGTTLPYLAYPQMDGGWYASAGLPTNGMRAIPTNNLGDGKEVAIVDLDGADATHDDMSMSNWGQNGNMLCLRISGGSHGVLTSKFPYHVKLKADLILSADL